ncbi:MAG TPA: hypothetical protein PLS49_03135 [Candidatus Woesebacteria bacterium]|nr:hypothetical protein [Candidatus Woesebacteria bacterium]
MRKFDEKELVYKLDKILKKEFGTNLSFHEFSAGYGIADLVFAPSFSFNKKIVKRSPITDFCSLSLLLTLEEGKIYTQNEINTLVPQYSQREVNRLLKSLVINNYMKKLNKDNYTKLELINPLNPIKSVIAIEVKLSDHKKGLTQARRYQYFADESYLAILKEAEKNINFEEFYNYNIGLILFDTNKNKIEIKHPNQINKNYQNTVNLFAKEMMLSKFMSFAS